MCIKMREAFKVLSNKSSLVETIIAIQKVNGFSVEALSPSSRLIKVFLNSPSANVDSDFTQDELNFISANLLHYIKFKDQDRSYPLSYYLDLMLEYRSIIDLSDVVIHSIKPLEPLAYGSCPHAHYDPFWNKSKAHISYRQYWDKRSEKPNVVKSEIILGDNYEGDRLAEDFELEGIKYYPELSVYYTEDTSIYYLATPRLEAVTRLLEKNESSWRTF